MMYTVCYESKRGKRASLLFEGLNLEAIARDPAIIALFPQGYFVKPVGDVNPDRYRGYWDRDKAPSGVKPKFTLVTTTSDARLPDEVKLGEPPMAFYVNGVQHWVDLRVRFNQCLSLFKAVGCASCPEKGETCLSDGAGIKVPSCVGEKFEGEDLIQMLGESKAVIAGHTFVPPMDTRVGAFCARLRPYWEHDFTEIEKNKKELSERATKAGETRWFKRTQCSQCVLQKNCEMASHCKGPLPPEQEIIDQCAPQMLDLIKRSDMPEWQLWELARGVGNTAKHSRWEIMLTGVRLQGGKLVMQVHRAKTDIQPYHGLKTYEEVAEKFDLALTEKDVPAKRGPVTDKNVLAIWWLLLQIPHPYETYGWGCRRNVLAIGVMRDHLELTWTNGSYINRHCTEMWKVADVSKVGAYGTLPGIQKLEAIR